MSPSRPAIIVCHRPDVHACPSVCIFPTTHVFVSGCFGVVRAATDITALVRSVTNRVEVDSHGTAENQPQATRHVPSALGLDRVAAHISELLAARVAEVWPEVEATVASLMIC